VACFIPWVDAAIGTFFEVLMLFQFWKECILRDKFQTVYLLTLLICETLKLVVWLLRWKENGMHLQHKLKK